MSVKLPKVVRKGKKRVGRGYGSGRGGHTSGRGTKGQKARNKNNILFEGVKMKKSFIKRLPLKRGKEKFKSKPKPLIVKLEYLNLFTSNSTVNLKTLIKGGIVKEVDARKCGVKVLGGGEIKKKLIVELPVSKSAARQIEKAGGKVVKITEELGKKTSEEKGKRVLGKSDSKKKSRKIPSKS